MSAFLLELEVDEYTPKAKSEQSAERHPRITQITQIDVMKSVPGAVATGS